jgi:hypothetical protein
MLKLTITVWNESGLLLERYVKVIFISEKEKGHNPHLLLTERHFTYQGTTSSG